MKEIKMAWGFDHVPDGTQYWLYSDMPAAPSGASFAQTALVQAFNGKRWVSGTAANAYVGFNVNDVGFNWTKRLIWGSRIYCAVPGNVRVWSFINTAGTAAGFTQIAANTVGVPAATECYLEMEIDVVGQKQNFYIDGNPIPSYTRALTTAQIASIVTTYPCTITGGNGTATAWYMKDCVFRHCSGADDISITGPVEMTMWNPAAVSVGPSFVGPVGIPQVQVISTFISDKVNSLVIPRLESPDGSSSGSMVVRMGIDPAKLGGKIYGVSIFTSVQDVAAAPHTLNAKVTQNSVDAILTGVLQKAAYQYGKHHGILQTAPDGSDWSAAKINSTDLTLSIA